MKAVFTFLVLLIFAVPLSSQVIDFGKYKLCYDMYWKCHFQIIIELKSDSTYEFTYRDDTRMEMSDGYWRIDSNFVILNPFFTSDSKIDLTIKMLGKNKIEEIRPGDVMQPKGYSYWLLKIDGVNELA